MEYKCTNKEILVITISMVAVKLSNKKPQDKYNKLDSNQVINFIEQILLANTISLKIIQDNKEVKIMFNTLSTITPFFDKKGVKMKK